MVFLLWELGKYRKNYWKIISVWVIKNWVNVGLWCYIVIYLKMVVFFGYGNFFVM